MLKFIELIRSKPSDRNIRLIRGGFAIILALVIYFGFSETHWNIASIPNELLYVLYVFPAIGLVRAVFDPGVFKKKIWKWTQVGLGVVMFVITLGFIETDTNTTTLNPSTVSGELSLSELTTTKAEKKFVVDTDFWFGFMGFWLAVGGLVFGYKNITKKNERYGETIKKIRV